MPSTPTVSRWPQNINDGPGARPSSTPMTLGRPGAASCSTTSSPAPAMAARATSAASASPGAPGTSDGLTEFAAMRSRRNGRGSMDDRERRMSWGRVLPAKPDPTPSCGLRLPFESMLVCLVASSRSRARRRASGARRLSSCAAEGAAVVLSARRADRLDEIVRAIASRGGRALAVPGDVTREDDMDALVARAVEAFGRST